MRVSASVSICLFCRHRVAFLICGAFCIVPTAVLRIFLVPMTPPPERKAWKHLVASVCSKQVQSGSPREALSHPVVRVVGLVEFGRHELLYHHRSHATFSKFPARCEMLKFL